MSKITVTLTNTAGELLRSHLSALRRTHLIETVPQKRAPGGIRNGVVITGTSDALWALFNEAVRHRVGHTFHRADVACGAIKRAIEDAKAADVRRAMKLLIPEAGNPANDEHSGVGRVCCKKCDAYHGDNEDGEVLCAIRRYAQDRSLPDDLYLALAGAVEAIEQHLTDEAIAYAERRAED